MNLGTTGAGGINRPVVNGNYGGTNLPSTQRNLYSNTSVTQRTGPSYGVKSNSPNRDITIIRERPKTIIRELSPQRRKATPLRNTAVPVRPVIPVSQM
jgi:hypothetical protein